MLARRRNFRHPSAGPFDLPLLVPSFSSKGFGLEQQKGLTHDYCPVAYELEEFGRVESRSVLVSAYDIHFQHFEAPQMAQTSIIAHLQNSGLVFLDSGGYEMTGDFDSAEIRRSNHQHKPGYNLPEYEAVLERIRAEDSNLPLIIVNADWSTRKSPLNEQVAAARQLFAPYSQYASTFIIKPGRGATVINPSDFSQADYKTLLTFV